MSTRTLRGLFGLALVACYCGCDGAPIAVFSTLEAGASGANDASAAASGADIAGSGNAGTSGTSGTSGGGTGGGDLNDGGVNDGGLNAAAGTGAGSGDAGASGMPCHGSNDCQPLWLCSKRYCSDAFGVCVARPALPDPSLQPVCGCDHVTYWNDALRQSYGVGASTPGECSAGARACYGNDDCGAGATCAHLLPPMTSCGSVLGPGTCWATPDDCVTGADKPHWQICPPPGSAGDGSSPCVSACQAVQSGRPSTPVPHGTPCP